jgi:hypothetical protein
MTCLAKFDQVVIPGDVKSYRRNDRLQMKVIACSTLSVGELQLEEK